MLLARRGRDVLVVDRETFPSDTISTHLIHPPGVAALERWGLLDRLVATGCPPIDTYVFDFGPITISGSPGTDDMPVAYAPRRTVLDKLLVDAASEAGAEVREGFTVENLVIENGRVTGVRGRGKDGRTVTEHSRVVIGADGLHSLVAQAVGSEQYNEKPPLNASYYTYWSGLPMNGRFEAYVRPNRAFAAWPTNDGVTLVICGWPFAEFAENKKDIERHYLEVIELVPAFADCLRTAKREARYVGTGVPNFFRKPFGPGWALVGDAGYNKDFITAQGIPCFPGRRTVHHRTRRVVLRRPLLRRRDGRVPIPARRARLAHVRIHHPARDAPAAAARAPAAAGGGPGQSGSDERVRARQRRCDVTRRVLLRRERQSHFRRGPPGERPEHIGLARFDESLDSIGAVGSDATRDLRKTRHLMGFSSEDSLSVLRT
jgi:2-polyprenyl-6-methoxyphenol hydroxylase-like FAD-dependent oxidoreductase